MVTIVENDVFGNKKVLEYDAKNLLLKETD